MKRRRIVSVDAVPVRLVDVVLGAGTADARHPRTGAYRDSWRRLLTAARLSP